MSDEHYTDDSDQSFAEVWSDFTDDILDERVELSIPDEFGREEWDTVGYIPPKRRDDSEVYNWSMFYDFFVWLQENGYHTDSEDVDRELLEELAALEHRQWKHWSQSISDSQHLSPHIIDRWKENWKPYGDLDEDSKEKDRRWARKVIDILEDRSITEENDE